MTAAGGAPIDVRETEEVALDALEPGSLRAVYRYWEERRSGRLAPSRQDIDPADLVPVLPHLVLLDVVRDGPKEIDFRYRVAGTENYAIHHYELTGMMVSQLRPASYGQAVWNAMRDVATTGRPHCRRVTFANQRGLRRSYLVLRLPLSADGRTIDQILGLPDWGAEQGAFADMFGSSLPDRA